MPDSPIYTYPFDPTGTNSTNLVSGERKVISPPNWTDFYFLVPSAAPYFHESLQVIHHPSGRILNEGVDYTCSHRFHDASLAIGKPIYGSITLYDKTLSGIIEMSYQTLGGAWTLDEAAILQILSDKTMDPRITTWEEITDLPFQFPVIDHQWDLVDLVGASELETAILAIRDAIDASGEGGLTSHLADFNNPHRVTKAQVGLTNVADYAPADLPTAQAGVDNATYMTPLRTAQAIATQALTPLNAHTSDFNNPHAVTSSQLGLGNVNNFPLATSVQAQAGTANTAYMTPLSTSQAISALALTPLNNHTADKTNPHEVTASQVGLGNVSNFATASNTDALVGTATNLFMTPAATRAAIAAISGGDLTDHVNNFNNPHQVTAAQVNLGNVQNYGIATTQQAQDAVDNNVYMTPVTTKAAVQALVGSGLANHINDTTNPHNVTKEQVGLDNVQNLPIASQSAAAAGTSSLSYMTPLATAQAIAAQATAPFNDHLADTSNPHAVTASQVGLDLVQNYGIASQAEAQAGTSSTVYMTPLATSQAIASLASGTIAGHLADFDNPHQVTAAQVGAYTTAETDQAINDASVNYLPAAGTAVDSNKLGGYTYNQINAVISAVAGSIPDATRFKYDAVNPFTDTAEPPVTHYEGATWTQLGSFVLGESATDPSNDIEAWLVGGDSRSSKSDSVYELHLSIRDNNDFTVIQHRGPTESLRFGYTIITGGDSLTRFTLWAWAPALRNEIQLLAVTSPNDMFGPTDQLEEVEPTGIVYCTATQASKRKTQPNTGEICYGPSFGAVEANAGALVNSNMLVQFMTVLGSADDPTNAQALAVDQNEFFHDCDRRSIYGTEPYFAFARDQWAYDSSNSVLRSNVPVGNVPKELRVLLSSESFSSYSFEVEISSDDTGVGSDQAVGVCVAYFEDGDRNYGIYAMRTPGGLVMSSQAGDLADGGYHKLHSVAFNMFQINAMDLGSTSASLTWGDGVADADRGTTAYAPVAWSTLGKCRLRVAVDATGVTIETTQLNSAIYVDAAKVTLVWESGDPILAMFKKRADTAGLRWGICAFQQALVGFELLNYPGRYNSYVVLPSDDNVTPGSYNQYNGAAWNTVSLNTADALFPGRFYYSELNHSMYFVRRDGTLKPMPFEAFTSDNHTVLTT